MFSVGHVKVDDIFPTPGRHIAENSFHKITMGVQHSHPFSMSDILTNQIFQECGLAGSCFANDPHVRPAVSATNTKDPPVVAGVRLGKEGDLVVILHPVIVGFKL